MRTTILLAAVAGALVAPGAAHACSLAGDIPSERERLEGARAAVVVRVTSVRGRDGTTPYLAVARLERLAKRGAGGVWLRLSTTEPSLCGLDLTVGERIGLFLNTRLGQRHWRLGILDEVAPSRLLRLARERA